MSLLITPSLISSIDWLKNCPNSWKESAYNDLKNQLARDYSKPMPEPVIRGIEFEKKVYHILDNVVNHDAYKIDKLECSNNFKKVLLLCKDSTFQEKAKSIVNIDNKEYCFYGKIDVLKNTQDLIIDIKTTGEMKSKSKYLDTIQHKMYCFSKKIKNFRYIVVIMEGKYKIKDIKPIDYEVEDFDKLREDLIERVKKAISFIDSDTELQKLYLTKFNRY